MRASSAVRLGSAACVLACSLLVGCSPAPSSPSGDDRLRVVVSVLPQAYFVERVGGDLVQVEALIPPGASPTNFEPSFAQLKALDNARLYVKVGHPHFPFERSWLEALLAEKEHLILVSTSEGHDHSHAGHQHDHDEDPHVWLAPSQVRRLAGRLHAALVKLLPERKTELDANLAGFLDEVDELDAELRELFAGDEGRRFFVFHPAWETFAGEYGLTQLAVEGHGKKPDPRTFSRLIATAKEAGTDVLFVEPQGNAQQAAFVAAEMNARVVTIDPLARDWATNLRQVAGLIDEALR